MYRIELAVGEEAVFKSLDELAVGIRNGIVTPHARIYHQKSEKWLPITLHPHYKLALSRNPAEAITAPKEKAPPAPVFSAPAEQEVLAPATPVLSSEPAPPLLTPPADASTPPLEASPAADPWHPATARVSSTRRWTIGLTLVGVLVVAAGGLALSWTSPVWGSRKVATPTPPKPVVTLTKFVEPSAPPASPNVPLPEPTVSESSVPSPAPIPAPVPDTPMAAPAPPDSALLPPAPAAIPRAPRILSAPVDFAIPAAVAPPRGGSGAVSPAALVQHYSAAYDAARAELETGMKNAGFANLFAASRLSSGEGVRAARRSAAATANFVRLYRRREITIEQAYRDSLELLTKRLGWSTEEIRQWEARPFRQEPPEAARLADALLGVVDSVFGILDAQERQYEISGSTITFRYPQAARQYGALRLKLAQQIAGWRESAGSAVTTTVDRVIRGTGPARLPEERTQ